MRITSLCVAAGAALLVLCLTDAKTQSVAAPPVKYTATEITPPAGVTSFFVTGMNEDGSLSANGTNGKGRQVALTRVGGVWTNLGLGFANDINASGTVVGQDAAFNAVAWNAGVPTTLVGLPPGTQADAINNGGEIIATQNASAFHVSSSSVVTSLGQFGTSLFIQVTGVNEGGVFAGFGSAKGGAQRPLRYAAGAFQDLLEGQPGATTGRADDINNAGQIAGSFRSGAADQATIWTGPAVHTDLSTPAGHSSVALGINNSGSVVGEVFKTGHGGREYASAWINGTLIDLDKATNNGALDLKSAREITDSGKILALSFSEAGLKFYILTAAGTTPGGTAELSGTVSGFTKKVTGRGDRSTVQLSGKLDTTNSGTAKMKKAAKATVFLSTDNVPGADLALKTVSIPALKEGTTRSLPLNSVKLPRGTDSAGKFFIIVLDTGNVIEEANETNNTIISAVLP